MLRRLISCCVSISFLFTLVIPVQQVHAQSLSDLPQPGTMVSISPAFEPILMKGIKVHPENPFLFDFIMDTGSSPSFLKEGVRGSSEQLKRASSKLIKYFLASLTIPEKDLWVNLSPYEKDRMIAGNLGQTQMGRDMLAQDYILKQLTASLIYPEKNLGKIFWDKLYAKAQQMYGTTQIPVNTFNKVWIVADKADVLERGDVAYIIGAHLKVMLEEDYLALSHTVIPAKGRIDRHSQLLAGIHNTHSLASQIIKQLVLPSIEQEVNQGKNFAPLRQMFYSMILASWYKMALKDALLTQVYGDKAKVKVGVNAQDPTEKDKIFQQYLKAYKKGVFNYIKEDLNAVTNQPMPRKYFSGGLRIGVSRAMLVFHDQVPQEPVRHTGDLFIARTPWDFAMAVPNRKKLKQIRMSVDFQMKETVKYWEKQLKTTSRFSEEMSAKIVNILSPYWWRIEAVIEASPKDPKVREYENLQGRIYRTIKGVERKTNKAMMTITPVTINKFYQLFKENRLKPGQFLSWAHKDKQYDILFGNQVVYGMPPYEISDIKGTRYFLDAQDLIQIDPVIDGNAYFLKSNERQRQKVLDQIVTFKTQDMVFKAKYKYAESGWSEQGERFIESWRQDFYKDLSGNDQHFLFLFDRKDQLLGYVEIKKGHRPQERHVSDVVLDEGQKGRDELKDLLLKRAFDYLKKSNVKVITITPVIKEVRFYESILDQYFPGLYSVNERVEDFHGYADIRIEIPPTKPVESEVRPLIVNELPYGKVLTVAGFAKLVSEHKIGPDQMIQLQVLGSDRPKIVPFNNFDDYRAPTMMFVGGKNALTSYRRRNIRSIIILPAFSENKSLAMVTAMGQTGISVITPGGIDLDRSKMRMNVRKEGAGVQMQFDRAAIERIRKNGFDGVNFEVESIIPVTDLPLFLGLKSPEGIGHV